ncbi:MAG: DUF2066 domain-containing protein, partial [Rhodospirillales bacterium]
VLIMAPAGAPAQTFDVFEVRGVAVDVTAETAAQAMIKAHADGQKEAFRRLLERLTPRSNHFRLPDFAVERIAPYVKDFSVEDEKTSPVRYLARLNFRFNADAVRQLLIDYDLPFAETPSKPVLVLPVYQVAGAVLLWDSPNPWRQSWAALPASDGLVPMMLAMGDLPDIAAIGAGQAVDGDLQRLSAIAARYNAGDVLVAQAVNRMDKRGVRTLDVYATRYGSALLEQTMIRKFSSQPGEDMNALLKRAAEEIALSVEDGWKRDNLLQFGSQAVIAVTVRIAGLEDWLTVRRRLSGVAVVRHAELVLLSRDEVRINLHYLGEREQLSLTLEQADLSLKRDGDDWILEPVRSFRP